MCSASRALPAPRFVRLARVQQCQPAESCFASPIASSSCTAPGPAAERTAARHEAPEPCRGGSTYATSGTTGSDIGPDRISSASCTFNSPTSTLPDAAFKPTAKRLEKETKGTSTAGCTRHEGFISKLRNSGPSALVSSQLTSYPDHFDIHQVADMMHVSVAEQTTLCSLEIQLRPEGVWPWPAAEAGVRLLRAAPVGGSTLWRSGNVKAAVPQATGTAAQRSLLQQTALPTVAFVRLQQPALLDGELERRSTCLCSSAVLG